MRTSFEIQMDGLHKSLKHGFKPSVWLHRESEDDQIKTLMDEGYPFSRICYENGLIFYWFFQNDTVKQQFVDSGLYKSIKEGYRDHRALGEILGFPPAAVDYFTKNIGTVRGVNNIFVSYGGIVFASYSETLKDDIEWLIKERPIPKGHDFKVVIGMNVISVDDPAFEYKIREVVDVVFV